MLKILGIFALVLAAAIGGNSAQAENLGLPPLKFDPSRVYFAIVGDRQLPFSEALFCSVKSGAFQSCKPKEGYKFGKSFHTRATIRTDPNIVLDMVPYRVPGRVALVSAAYGNRGVRPTTVTYYFDARPGTVFVLGPPKRDAKLSVSQTSAIFIEQFGEQFGQLSYVHMSAAKITCVGKASRRSYKCTLGKQIDLRSVAQKYN